ncbi:unnamed protein product [Haemonchus placei]|uniref:MATH domain-containing protein n=1 Tax=Haemonchus placei TaxID=6290 RepID=A0A0N4X9Y7_HAEPC|nr:unnamed protein product [Haemonchus placei]
MVDTRKRRSVTDFSDVLCESMLFQCRTEFLRTRAIHELTKPNRLSPVEDVEVRNGITWHFISLFFQDGRVDVHVPDGRRMSTRGRAKHVSLNPRKLQLEDGTAMHLCICMRPLPK